MTDEIDNIAKQLTDDPCVSRSHEKKFLKEAIATAPLSVSADYPAAMKAAAAERYHQPKKREEWSKSELNDGIRNLLKFLKSARRSGIIGDEQYQALLKDGQKYFQNGKQEE